MGSDQAQQGDQEDTMGTERTIEEILAIRLRAAELRVLERAAAVLKAYEAIEQAFGAGEREQEQLAKMIEAKELADEALALVHREIEAQKGIGEPVVYEPAAGFGTRRYAAVLMLDNPELDAAKAADQARRDEAARFEEFYARVHGDEDEGLEDEDEATEEAQAETELPFEQQVSNAIRSLWPAEVATAIEVPDGAIGALVYRLRVHREATGQTPQEALEAIDPDNREFAGRADEPAAFLAAKIHEL